MNGAINVAVETEYCIALDYLTADMLIPMMMRFLMKSGCVRSAAEILHQDHLFLPKGGVFHQPAMLRDAVALQLVTYHLVHK